MIFTEFQLQRQTRTGAVSPAAVQLGLQSGIITRNQEMLAIFEYLCSISQSTQPVLITGETGVGKELIARAIHISSGARGRLVTVNAAGLDDNVFSDTLFGHVRGAFTGADRDRQGLIEKAKFGTLFLDEIGDLTSASQVKLLRLIQENEYLPLGQDEPKNSNARIVTATNMDLWVQQRSGQFRKDLNFRLRTHHMNIPPLRNRLDDLPLLVDHFMKKAADNLRKKPPTAPRELIPLLSTYSFPGNIRELEAMIFDAVSRHRDRILTLETFKFHMEKERNAKFENRDTEGDKEGQVFFPSDLPTIKQATDLLVEEAMKRAQGNQSIAARMLGISRQALGKRLKNKPEDTP
ncbi:MAG: sigma 54-interacting transcriptional regulator [Thermodesulfobacteriota bacterium]